MDDATVRELLRYLIDAGRREMVVAGVAGVAVVAVFVILTIWHGKLDERVKALEVKLQTMISLAGSTKPDKSDSAS